MDTDRTTGGAGRGVLRRPFPYARSLSERHQPPADAVVAAGCAPGDHGKCRPHSARRRNGHSRATPDGPLPTAQEEPVLAGHPTPAPGAWPGGGPRPRQVTAGPENPSFHHRRGCCAPPAAGLEGRCRPIIPAPVLRLIYEDPTGKALRANAPEPQDCTNR